MADAGNPQYRPDGLAAPGTGIHAGQAGQSQPLGDRQQQSWLQVARLQILHDALAVPRVDRKDGVDRGGRLPARPSFAAATAMAIQP